MATSEGGVVLAGEVVLDENRAIEVREEGTLDVILIDIEVVAVGVGRAEVVGSMGVVEFADNRVTVVIVFEDHAIVRIEFVHRGDLGVVELLFDEEVAILVGRVGDVAPEGLLDGFEEMVVEVFEAKDFRRLIARA